VSSVAGYRSQRACSVCVEFYCLHNIVSALVYTPTLERARSLDASTFSLEASGLELRVEVLGFGVWGLGFGVQGSTTESFGDYIHVPATAFITAGQGVVELWRQGLLEPLDLCHLMITNIELPIFCFCYIVFLIIHFHLLYQFVPVYAVAIEHKVSFNASRRQDRNEGQVLICFR